MRSPWFFLIVAFSLVACRSGRLQRTALEQEFSAGRRAPETAQHQRSRPTGAEASGPIVTLGGPMKAKVASVNGQARFVVLRFPIGTMAAAGDRFSVYRDGLKVGELKISGPQQDNHVVADITAGACLAGDEARGEP